MPMRIKNDAAFDLILSEAMNEAANVFIRHGFDPGKVGKALTNPDFRDTLYHEMAPCAPDHMVEEYEVGFWKQG